MPKDFRILIYLSSIIFLQACLAIKLVVTKIPKSPFFILVKRLDDYSRFKKKFGHLEGETIDGVPHKSTVITLVERFSKVIITLKPNGCKVKDMAEVDNNWFQSVLRNLFKPMTFNCGKELSNCKSISNQHYVVSWFADPESPSQ